MTDSILASGDRTAAGGRSLSLPAWLVPICIIAFTTLLVAGAAIWKNAPPVPDEVRSPQQKVKVSSGRALCFSRIFLNIEVGASSFTRRYKYDGNN